MEELSNQITSISLKFGELLEFCLLNNGKSMQSDMDKRKLKAKWVVKEDSEWTLPRKKVIGVCDIK